MVKVEAVVIRERVETVIDAVEEQTGHVGVTVVEAIGHGRQRGITHEYRGRVFESRFLPKAVLTFIVDDDIEIDIVHGDRSPRNVPIYIGATGMKMMELAGEIGDGVLLNYLVGPRYNHSALEHLAAGAARAGRTLEDVDRPQLVVCSLDEDREAALDRARELVTQYLGQQPHIGKASGVDQSLLDEIGRVLTWPASEEEIRGAMKLVPDDVVQMITASGTPDECRAKVREYVEGVAPHLADRLLSAVRQVGKDVALESLPVRLLGARVAREPPGPVVHEVEQGGRRSGIVAAPVQLVDHPLARGAGIALRPEPPRLPRRPVGVDVHRPPHPTRLLLHRLAGTRCTS